MGNVIREFKVNIHVDPIDGMSMSDYDFECIFSVYSNRYVTINKSDMKKIDKDNYIAIFTADKVKALGKGSLRMTFVGYIPDSDFPDGYRTEVSEISDIITSL